MASESPCNCKCNTHVTNSPEKPSASTLRNITLHQFLPVPFQKHSSTPTSPAEPTPLGLSSCSHHSLLSSSFDTCKSSTMCPSKRDTCDSSDSDQRFKRLIKNRDSAARSRARKQAYKNELETKLALLMEENSRLRRQVQELQLRLKSSDKPSKMHTLCRTSTSPF